jgi:DMSO/TMAO reductase YedYZ heme-binding membrane subunit
MPTKWIPWVKVAVHGVCLLPFLKLLWMYQSGALGLMADPVLDITHETGYWALFLLIASLAVTPVRRISPRFSMRRCILRRICFCSRGTICRRWQRGCGRGIRA